MEGVDHRAAKAEVLGSSTTGSLSDDPWKNYTQTVGDYDQLLDHFDPTAYTVFKQRYFAINDFFKAPAKGQKARILLHVCGEYTCEGIFPFRLAPMKDAYDLGAAVVSLEHRFFGESYPFEQLTTENLRYQSVLQALADLAQFQQWYQGHLVSELGLPADTEFSVVVVGGSYPGALASWYRVMYPWLTVGSHSASGVVEAIRDFTAFDEQVATSAGPECAAALRQATMEVTAAMPGVKARFNAQDLEIDGDFWYFLADAAAELVQYAHTPVLCKAMLPPYRAGKPVLDAWVDLVNGYFVKTLGNSPGDYDQKGLAKTGTGPGTNFNGRSWWWMKCTQVAFWQVAPSTAPIRSRELNDTYHRELCKSVFGLDSPPNVTRINTLLGGNSTGVAPTIWTNGGADPWQHAGVVRSLGPDKQAVVVSCEDEVCAHCQTLYTPEADDPQPLVEARALVSSSIKKWYEDADARSH